MKRIFFMFMMMVATINLMAQEDRMQIIAGRNVLAGEVESDYSILALKTLQQSKIDGVLLDARVVANEDFLASATTMPKSYFFWVNQRSEVDALVSAVGRFFKWAQVKFIAADLSICEAILKQASHANVVYVGDDQDPKELRKAGLYGVQYSLPLLQAHPELVIEAHASKLAVLTDAGDELKSIVDLPRMHVDYLFSNEPYLLSSVTEGKILLKVMSFNVRMCGMSDYDGENRWDNRKEAVVKMLNEQTPDLLGVQEMLPPQKEYLVRNLNQYKMVGVGRDDGKNEGEYMGIFYNPLRFELQKKDTYWLSETPDQVSQGWDAACKRTVTFVQLLDKQSGRIVCYFNTHLDHVGDVARHKSVELLVDLIHKLAPEGAVVVLGGDMNTDLSNDIFEPLRGSGMQAVRETALQTDNVLSYNAYGKEKNSCIDNLFYYNAKPLVFKTLVKNYGVPYISDHYPVIGFFEL